MFPENISQYKELECFYKMKWNYKHGRQPEPGFPILSDVLCPNLVNYSRSRGQETLDVSKPHPVIHVLVTSS